MDAAPRLTIRPPWHCGHLRNVHGISDPRSSPVPEQCRHRARGWITTDTTYPAVTTSQITQHGRTVPEDRDDEKAEKPEWGTTAGPHAPDDEAG